MVDSTFPFSITSRLTETTANTYETELRLHLERHIEYGDFFHLLATYFGFLEETAADPDSVPAEMRLMQAELARSIRFNLQHLAEGYHVRPKTV